MICKHIFDNILNESKRILMDKVKRFQVLVFITNNSIKHQTFVYSLLNNQTDLFQTIQFSIRQQS